MIVEIFPLSVSVRGTEEGIFGMFEQNGFYWINCGLAAELHDCFLD
jgi:hypothetical protein